MDAAVAIQIIIAVVGVTLGCGGACWFRWEKSQEEVSAWVARWMEKDGLWEGEEEYMRTFRVGEAVGDVFAARRRQKIALIVLTIGVMLIVAVAGAKVMGW